MELFYFLRGGIIMTQFYISVIFIGIILVALSLVWIFYDRKKAYDYTKNVESMKAGLLGMMKDAEEMVEELNRISGYILENIDSKTDELKQTLLLADEKIKKMKSLPIEKNEVKKEKNEAKKENTENKKENTENKKEGSCREVIGIQAIQLKNFTEEFNSLKNSKPKSWNIASHSRYKEVVKLSQSGMGQTEIAKKLNMGKGEIELVLGMNSSNMTIQV